MFTNGRADNISIQLDKSDKPRHSKAQAIAAYQYMIPTDAMKIKEYTTPNDPNSDVIVYKSKLLAKVFSVDEFDGSTPGPFDAVLTKDIEDPSKYGLVMLFPGDNP